MKKIKKTPFFYYIVMAFFAFVVFMIIIGILSVPFREVWYWKIWLNLFLIENELFKLIALLFFAFVHIFIISVIGSMILPDKIKKQIPFPWVE